MGAFDYVFHKCWICFTSLIRAFSYIAYQDLAFFVWMVSLLFFACQMHINSRCSNYVDMKTHFLGAHDFLFLFLFRAQKVLLIKIIKLASKICCVFDRYLVREGEGCFSIKEADYESSYMWITYLQVSTGWIKPKLEHWIVLEIIS